MIQVTYQKIRIQVTRGSHGEFATERIVVIVVARIAARTRVIH